MLLLVAPATLFSAEAVNASLQQALYEEEANQNLDAAIAAYQSILKAHQEERKLAATAQFRLGQCYRKLGRTNDAVQQYRQLLRDFSDQTNLVRLSEQSLAALDKGESPAGGFAERLQTIVQSASPDPEALEINRLETLIKESPDLINARADMPPLHQAVRGHQVRVATFLLDRGADVNLRDNAGNTALSLAAQLGDRQMVELLIERNANVNLENQKNTALLVAANNGFKSIVELLLAKGADISATDARERTALHIAAADNRKEIAEVLLARKADLNARSLEGSPLYLAVQRGLVNMASLLISRGADVDAKGPNGQTALVQAIAHLNQALVEMLLEHKADPNARYELTFDAVPDLPNPNNYKPTINAAQLTPMMLAANAGHTSIVSVLIKAGADVNAQDSTGTTALLWAVRRDRPGAVDALLNGGAEVNRADRYGLTPLGMAAALGREALVRALLQHGAAPNLTAASEPPLHGAVRYRHKAVIEMLLDAGADVGATDRYGQTALDLAKLNRYPNQERGYNAPTIDGPELVTLLRQRGASEYVPRAGLITVCRISRGFSQPYLFKGTNDYNRHTLLELIVAVYGDPTARNSAVLAFPDVANLRISRRDPGMKQLREIKVDLNSLLPTNDVPLEWGDVVEIPELDHRANESWDGFAGPDIEAINRILTRKIEIRVKGESYPVTLVPSWNASTRPIPMVMGGLGSPLSGAVPVRIPPALAPGQPGPLGGVPVGALGQPGPLGGVPGGVPGIPVGLPPSARELAPSFPPGQPGRTGAPVSAPKTLSGFRLRSVMLQANVLRVSSDLSRVKVRRTDPKTKQVQELLFDLATTPANNDPSDLWLQDGDIIDVPERGA
jgi:ankyrin repeat protein